MLAIERRIKIMNLLKENQSVTVPELSKLFDVTNETIRRDLEKLEQEGLLKRTYGGAVILNESMSVDVPIRIREVTNIEGKQSIGKKVSEFIEDGDTIMLDSSTTALQAAKYIKNKNKITVITNSEKVIAELSGTENCTVISTGGRLRVSSLSFVGHLAEETLRNFYVDKAVISCKGIDLRRGITDSNEMETQIKKAMVNAADKVFLAVDHTKFDKASFVKVMELEKINMLFTDKKLSDDWEDVLKKLSINLVYA